MNELTLFEIASREEFTFPSTRGNLDIADLWILPLLSAKQPCLNGIAVVLSNELDSIGAKSFVSRNDANPKRKEIQQKLDVVLRVIEVREFENSAARQVKHNADRRAILLEALEAKSEESIQNMTEEEIRVELAKL